MPFVRQGLQVLVLSSCCKYVAQGRPEATSLHVSVHVSERPLSLAEEVKDDALAKLSLARLFIHLQDLFEGSYVDVIAEVEVFGLSRDRG